jgi:ribosomal protein L11
MEKSFIVSSDINKVAQDRRKVRTYRFTVEAGKVKKESFLYLNNLFSNIDEDILNKICNNLNEKTKAYQDNFVSISILATANHTFKFKIEDIYSKTDKQTKRVAISLSNEEYNELINIHASTNNKTISHTLKEIYLHGLKQKNTVVSEMPTYKASQRHRYRRQKEESWKKVPISTKTAMSYKDIAGLSLKELQSTLSGSVKKQSKEQLKVLVEKIEKDNIVPIIEIKKPINDKKNIENKAIQTE